MKNRIVDTPLGRMTRQEYAIRDMLNTYWDESNELIAWASHSSASYVGKIRKKMAAERRRYDLDALLQAFHNRKRGKLRRASGDVGVGRKGPRVDREV
jgi:hypothetical protein